MAVRSTDNGKTWSKPVVAIDTDLDDRDPSVACLKDGTLLLNWFTLHKNQVAVLLARSTDNGKTWSESASGGVNMAFNKVHAWTPSFRRRTCISTTTTPTT